MRLWLHIGLPKTGTSFIQTVLVHNGASLLEQGFLYPGSGRIEGGHALLAFPLLSAARSDRPDVRAHVHLTGAHLWQDLADEVKEHQPASILLSSEYFSEVEDLRGLKELLDSIADEIGIVVFLRRQDDLIEAGWNQEVKAGLTAAPLTFGGYAPYYDWKCFLDRWSAVFGREHIHVRVFGDGDVFQDFSGVVGLSTAGIRRERAFRNDRLPAALLEYRRIENALSLIESDLAQRVSRRLSISALAVPEKDQRAARSRFLAEYAESNSAVAREYLGRGDGILFNDDAPKAHDSEKRGSPARLNEEMLHALIATSWMESRNSLQALREEVNRLREEMEAIKERLRD